MPVDRSSSSLPSRLLIGLTIILVGAALTAPARAVVGGPTLLDAIYYGGAGDQYGNRLVVAGSDLYVAAHDAAALGGQALAIDFDVPPTATPQWAAHWPGSAGHVAERFDAVAATPTGVYFAGRSFTQTVDFLGAKEAKTVVVKYDRTGPPGPATGGAQAIAKRKFFPFFDGLEFGEALLATADAGNDALILGASGQTGAGNNTAVAQRYDASLTAQWTTVLGSVANPAHSSARGLTQLNGFLYAAGTQRNGAFGSDAAAMLWKLDQAGNVLLTGSAGAAGLRRVNTAVTSLGGALYTAGFQHPSGAPGPFDVFLASFDELGNLLWQTSWGGLDDDAAWGIAALGGRLWVAGETNSLTGSTTDAFLIEVDPTDGTVLSETYFGGGFDDGARDLVAHGDELYVVGYTCSFQEGGNGMGQSDVLLLRYSASGVAAGPTITCPPDVTVGNDPRRCDASVDLGQATAEPADAVVTGVRSDGLALDAPYPVGVTIITWTATDADGNTDTCDQTITVNDVEAPRVRCRPLLQLRTDRGQCYSTRSVPAARAWDNCPGVTVDGVRSDGLPLTDPWPLGETAILWTATDAAGHTATCDQTVQVFDKERPRIYQIEATPDVLLPPDGSLREVVVSVKATDNCDPQPTCQIVGVNDSDRGAQHGDDADVVITGPLTLKLRAETANPQRSRRYQIVVACRDASGNTSLCRTVVTAPPPPREPRQHK